MPSVELVIFDMAGTTVYDGNFVAECLQSALLADQIEVSIEEIRPYMGIPKPQAIKALIQLKENKEGIDPKRIDRLHLDFLKKMIRLYNSDPRVKEMPGASAVFAQLRKAGVKVALNTGFSRPIADTVIRRLDWEDKIDLSVCSDEVLNGRPAPDMGEKIMSDLGVRDPLKVAKVGDTLSDLQEGEALGVGLNVGVLSGAYTRKQLAAGPHTHIFEDITDLPALVL